MIEAILKYQQEEALPTEDTEALLSQDAKAVEEALKGGTEKEEKDEAEEMLSDIQFPECGSQNSLDSLTDGANTSAGDSVVRLQ